MNALTITWAIITPTKGKATKKDVKLMAKNSSALRMGYQGKLVAAHFSNKDKAIEVVTSFTGLSKKYEVYFITDKQFGKTVGMNFLAVLTTMQKEAKIII